MEWLLKSVINKKMDSLHTNYGTSYQLLMFEINK
jgi:hypothetical protein